MSMLPSLVAVGLIAIIAILANIALDVRHVRRVLSEKLALPIPYETHPVHPRGAHQVAAFSVWAYKQNQWILVQECGQEGCVCGPAPGRKGRFDGEVVRKECSEPSTP
jgi:hypothetical protein